MRPGQAATTRGSAALRGAGIAPGNLLLAFVATGYFPGRIATAAANRMLAAPFTVPARVDSAGLGPVAGRAFLESLATPGGGAGRAGKSAGDGIGGILNDPGR